MNGAQESFRGRPYQLGDVYLVRFHGVGCEQSGTRPCVVFQNDKGNWFSPNVIMLPLTSAIKKTDQPTHVFVKAADNGLRCDSIVLCENPQCVSKDRIVGHRLTTLSRQTMQQIAAAFLVATGCGQLLGLRETAKAFSSPLDDGGLNV